ncbi:unnamed protein product [Lymnaea stagnalis]|uniref:Uncharacterized protein n=1 Tax=Lymnaea stagnalis TaxID=6523 RepID=A0AAV2IH60_LYMST
MAEITEPPKAETAENAVIQDQPAKVKVNIFDHFVIYTFNERFSKGRCQALISSAEGSNNEERVIFEVSMDQKIVARHESKPFSKGEITKKSEERKGSNAYKVAFKCKHGIKLINYFDMFHLK